MENQNEIWKPVLGYKGLYEVSNLGRVKSLPKEWISGKGVKLSHNGKILKQSFNLRGYLRVGLYKNNKVKFYLVSRVVWESFNGKTDLHIDHIIEGDNKNNRLDNLQPLKSRFNTHKYTLTKNKSSKYIGVRFHKQTEKWEARIYFNKKSIYLGTFKTELEAHQAYQNKLKEIEHGK